MSSRATLTRPRPNASGGPLPLLEVFGAYDAPDGTERSVLALARPDGARLIVDRRSTDGHDPRLVALLAAEEPAENGTIVAAMYLSDPTRGRCGALSAEDVFPTTTRAQTAERGETYQSELRDAHGGTYAIRVCRLGAAPGHLRWTRTGLSGSSAETAIVTVRDVIGALQSYEPARAVTASALAAGSGSPGVSLVRLRTELERLEASPLVLNRLLRETVLRHVEEGATFSQIALRCGRTKRDHRGVTSGETSWLARRIGLMAESGAEGPTPWLHCDTLALIARRGLGVAPVEVEL